jgi:predicted esterase
MCILSSLLGLGREEHIFIELWPHITAPRIEKVNVRGVRIAVET